MARLAEGKNLRTATTEAQLCPNIRGTSWVAASSSMQLLPSGEVHRVTVEAEFLSFSQNKLQKRLFVRDKLTCRAKVCFARHKLTRHGRGKGVGRRGGEIYYLTPKLWLEEFVSTAKTKLRPGEFVSPTKTKLWGEGFVSPTKNKLRGEGFVSPTENKL